MRCAQDGRRGHALMSEEARKSLPPIKAQDGKGDEAVAHVKLFSAFGRMTLYVTEFDGEDLLFGYMISPLGPDCDEWGYSSLSEWAEATVFGGVPAVERDCYWDPKPVAECLAAVA